MHLKEFLSPYTPEEIDHAKGKYFPGYWTYSQFLPETLQPKFFVRTNNPRERLLARIAQPSFVRAEYSYSGSKPALVAESFREHVARLVHTGGTIGERVFFGGLGLTLVALVAGAATDNLNLRVVLAIQVGFGIAAVVGAKLLRREAEVGIRNAITY